MQNVVGGLLLIVYQRKRLRTAVELMELKKLANGGGLKDDRLVVKQQYEIESKTKSSTTRERKKSKYDIEVDELMLKLKSAVVDRFYLRNEGHLDPIFTFVSAPSTSFENAAHKGFDEAYGVKDLVQMHALDHHQFLTSQHLSEYNLQGRNFTEEEDDGGVNHRGGVNGGKNQNKRKRVDKKSDIIKERNL
ncbi:hypothetical protein AAHA92_27258 [Salvia divinorum]|uniref:Uncharacterized protein n=1 Tax=Salvia divinorum TaxID=28513 RepID=A0ABD1G680_SALDI